MDYTKNLHNPLSSDIVVSAYERASDEAKSIVSSVLTQNPSESSFLYSYISNAEAKRALLNRSNKRSNALMGFTYMVGNSANASLLIINSFDIFEKMTGGRELVKTIVAGLLTKFDEEEINSILEEVKEYGS